MGPASHEDHATWIQAFQPSHRLVWPSCVGSICLPHRSVVAALLQKVWFRVSPAIEDSGACPLAGADGPHKGASRPGAIEHWTVEQWTILRLRSTSLLSIPPTHPLLQFPMLQGAKRLPGPLRPPGAPRGMRLIAAGRSFGIPNGKFQIVNLRSAIFNSERSEDWWGPQGTSPLPAARRFVRRGAKVQRDISHHTL